MKFRSVLLSSSWSSMFVVINKIRWCLAVRVVNCTVDRRSSQCSSHRSDSQIFVENRDCHLPHLHSSPPLAGPRQNIAMTFVTKKSERRGYPMVKKNWRHVYSFWQNVRTWQTDRHRTTASTALMHSIAQQYQNLASILVTHCVQRVVYSTS